VLPLALALYAMTPDFIYGFNPFHRDWMDVFLFHVALDEILPFALIVLAVLFVLPYALVMAELGQWVHPGRRAVRVDEAVVGPVLGGHRCGPLLGHEPPLGWRVAGVHLDCGLGQ